MIGRAPWHGYVSFRIERRQAAYRQVEVGPPLLMGVSRKNMKRPADPLHQELRRDAFGAEGARMGQESLQDIPYYTDAHIHIESCSPAN
jgi:hypothetical protein